MAEFARAVRLQQDMPFYEQPKCFNSGGPGRWPGQNWKGTQSHNLLFLFNVTGSSLEATPVTAGPTCPRNLMKTAQSLTIIQKRVPENSKPCPQRFDDIAALLLHNLVKPLCFRNSIS
jgi:hypothetical protein